MRRWAAFALGLLLATSAAAQTTTSSTISSQGSGSGSGSSSGGGEDLLNGTLCVDDDGFLVRTASGTCAIRGFTSADGTVVIVNPNGIAGDVDLTADTAVIARYASGTADATGNCSVGTFFNRTDTNESWFCTATNTWTKLVKVASTLTANLPVIGGGTSLIAVGTRSGNTTAYVTTTGTQTSGDCVEIDANGNHIASGAACGTGGSGSDLSDVTKAFFHEEFGAGIASTGNIGDLSWTLTQVGSAGTVTAVATSEANHPGVIDFVTGTTDNGGPYLTAGTLDDGDYASEDWEMNWLLKPESAVTDTYFSVGLNAGAPGAATAGIRAIYDTDHAHATWIFQICDNSTSGCQSAGDDTNADTVASTKAPVAGTWQRIRIRGDQTGVGGVPTIYFSVGDGGAMETEKTFCSSGCDSTMANMPTSVLGIRVGSLARAAATSKTWQLDYMYMGISGMVRY